MSINLTVNGSSYAFPTPGENPGWGSQVTAWAQAISQSTLQKSGGSFTLTGEVDLGASYGIKLAVLKSRTTGAAQSGLIRLAKTDTIAFRNALGTGDLALGVGSADTVPAYAGKDLVNVDAAQTLTGKTISGSTSTLSDIPWASVVKTGSNLTDLTTKSHTALSDIGTNTHAQIDSYITNQPAATQVLENKTLEATCALVDTTDNTKTLKWDLAAQSTGVDITLTTSAETADRVLTLPVLGGPQTLVLEGLAQTLTSKTLTSPSIGTDAKFTNEAIAKFYEASGTGTNFIGIKAPAAVTADKTFILPDGDGSNGQLLGTNGSLQLGWVSPLTNPMDAAGEMIVGGAAGAASALSAGTAGQCLVANGAASPVWMNEHSPGIKNLSLTAAVSGHNLTIAVKDAAGSDPAAGSPALISFRNATLATGTEAVVAVTGALSVVVESGSSLGLAAGVAGYVNVYAINNAGTVELAVINGGRDEGLLVTTVDITGTGSDSANVLYSNDVRSNVACRYLGRVFVAPAAAFAWDNAPTEISLKGCPSSSVVGRTDGVAPASGMVGERIERPIFSLSITSSGAIQNADAIPLTAGRWRVCCGAYATNNAATTTWTDFWGIGISTTNNAFTGIVDGESASYVQPAITTGSKYVAALKVERTFNVGAGGQTVYVNHVGYYTGNNPVSTGRIWAVREA
jgi:hypothetical protein